MRFFILLVNQLFQYHIVDQLLAHKNNTRLLNFFCEQFSLPGTLFQPTLCSPRHVFRQTCLPAIVMSKVIIVLKIVLYSLLKIIVARKKKLAISISFFCNVQGVPHFNLYTYNYFPDYLLF